MESKIGINRKNPNATGTEQHGKEGIFGEKSFINMK